MADLLYGVEQEIHKITLLLRIQQIQQALPNLTARGVQIEYRYFPMSLPPCAGTDYKSFSFCRRAAEKAITISFIAKRKPLALLVDRKSL
jgi:hypothetical protein